MKEPLYREALSHSWQLTWRHKGLWVFGLFAALLGQMGILDLLSKVAGASADYGLYPHWLALPKFFVYAGGWSNFSLSFTGWIWFIWLLVIMAGVGLFLLFTAVVSQGAIISSAAKFAKNKKLPDAGQAWHIGVSHFWRLFFLNLIKKAVVIVLAVMVGYGTYNFINGETGASLFLFLVIFLLAVLVGMVLSFLVIYTAGYIVVEEYTLGRALEAAWKMFTSHWLVSIEVALVILFLNIFLGVIVMSGFVVIFFPTLLAWMIANLVGSYIIYIIGVLVGILLFLAFIILVGSMFNVYVTSVWTYLFMKMHKGGIMSRILHWGGHYKK